jgi:predicted transcriptional regulator
MKNTYSFRLSDELINALDRAAADQNRTRGNLVETILLSAMEEEMKSARKLNGYEVWQEERNHAINKFADINLGELDTESLNLIAAEDIEKMAEKLADADINLETVDGQEALKKIVDEYTTNDTRVALMYDGQCFGKILTNHSLSIEDAFALLGIDIDEQDGGDFVWDYDLFSMG